MTDHRYRFRLPDGQVFEALGLEQIQRAYPDAAIEGRIDFNERGEGTLVPYRAELPTMQAPPTDDETEADAPVDDAEPSTGESPATSGRRRRAQAS